MNNIINISKHNLSQTNISAVTSSVSITIDGVDTAVATNSTDLSSSFRATFQKISDQSTFNVDVSVNEVAGNNLPANLPLTDVFPELSAENDHVLTANSFDDTNLFITENGHWMSNINDTVIVDEDQSLTAEIVLNKSSVTDEHVDEEPNYSVSSLMPLPSLMNSSSTKSLTQPSEVVSDQLKNVSDSKLIGNKIRGESGNDLVHAAVTHTAVTKPVSESIMKSSTQQVELATPSISSLQPALGATETTGGITKETATKNRLNNFDESGEELLQGQLLTSAKAVSKGEVTNDIRQNFIDNNVSKQAVENEITVLQDDLVTVDEVLLKSKQNLYSQKLVGSVEQYSFKSNSVAATLSNVKLNNQEAVELSKLDAALSSTTIVSNQTEEIASTVATINGFSPQLRASLQTRANTEISQVDSVSVTLSGNSMRLESTRLENNLMQSMDGLSLTTESSGLLSNKISNLPNTLTQQQLFAATQASQASHLVQTTTKVVDTYNDSLLGITSPVLNNITNVSTFVNSLSPPQAEITEAFGRSAWPQAMGKQVLSMINQNIGSAEIRLNPAHLGPIEILIDMTEDQVNVSLTSRHAVVREAMEQALPRLREMLDENGFNLADADISKHSFDEQREQNTKNNDHATDINATTIDQLTTSEIIDSGIRHTTESTGTVDYFV